MGRGSGLASYIWRPVLSLPGERATGSRGSQRGEGLVREGASGTSGREPGCGGTSLSRSTGQGRERGRRSLCKPLRRGDAPEELGRGAEESEEGRKVGSAHD